ncbi:type III secretion apparatus protein OrgA/MxiK [Acerihabitans arboris]|uniref:Type III secretion apparatus protein OrgA/MxiK n=1 Tax=Acerihabitans arboris TaxID=2691583 RepID=A0A845SJJ8_9GAMM|nr:type III secretion apparatus protein OrgA/MxiK [Acerihabitans arboris]NDL61505.1 type III secretion apparatus protein OrgA/MxiK [Acerihabitans arboris]
MKTIAPLDSILCDPLSWMHPRRLPLPPALGGASSRSIINGMIIRSHSWSVEYPPPCASRTADLFIRHWRRLPQVALLIAVQRHRASLARQGRLLQLPPWARQFSALAIVDSYDDGNAPVEIPGTLIAWGKRELLAFGDPLPLAIRQRISLLFSPELDRETGCEPKPVPSQLLIKLAFQHAERYSTTPDAADFRRRIDQAPAVGATTRGA